LATCAYIIHIEQLVEGGIAINIKAMIFFALMKFCGLFEN